MMSSSMASSSAAGAAPKLEVSVKDHQKFNQFLRYNAANASSKKHEQASTLAMLYNQISSADDKKAFVARWLKSGGAKGDIKLQVQQEICFLSETNKNKNVGHMTPGIIAKHLELRREVYTDAFKFEEAIRHEIQRNQAKFPPPQEQLPVEEGHDFWTSRYWYTHLGAQEVKESSKTGQMMHKSADLAAGNSATPLAATQMLPGFEGNLAITAPAAPEDAGASTKEGKQQLLLAKKIKYASKCFNSLLQHLAKCRTQALLNGGKSLRAIADKAESECASIPEKLASKDLTLEDIPGILETIQTLQNGLYKCFPDLAPRSKQPKGDEEDKEEDGAVDKSGKVPKVAALAAPAAVAAAAIDAEQTAPAAVAADAAPAAVAEDAAPAAVATDEADGE